MFKFRERTPKTHGYITRLCELLVETETTETETIKIIEKNRKSTNTEKKRYNIRTMFCFFLQRRLQTVFFQLSQNRNLTNPNPELEPKK